MERSIVEASFVELITDIKVHQLIRQDPVYMIKAVKDIANQSGVKNLFDHPLINKNDRVKIVPDAVPNQITPSEWDDEQYVGIWIHSLPALVIPVEGVNHMYWKFRIAISCDHMTPEQISIQMLPRRNTDAKNWVTIPAKTNNVMRILSGFLTAA